MRVLNLANALLWYKVLENMAVVEIRRQVRATSRAWRNLLRRRIHPSIALRLIIRSCGKVLHAVSLLTLLVIGGSIVAALMLITRLFFRLRDSRFTNRVDN